MSSQVMKRKLNLINYIKDLDEESLSKQVFLEQRKHSWPGPSKESEDICSFLNLESISNHSVSKREIENVCKQKTENYLKRENGKMV